MKKIILDIGCGKKKLPGSIGLDFSDLSDADIKLNLSSERLPFQDSTVDDVFSSHALEHFTDEGFIHILKEIYRVLKPEGYFYLIVPYFTTLANLANPFHNNNICFNEHTFRFFSSDEDTLALPKAEYQTLSLPQWGLRYSAHAELGVEFVLENLRFYYNPEFSDLSENEKFRLRKTRFDVVDQISYLLRPIKPCPVRIDTAPGAKDTGSEYEYIEGQLDYLKRQLQYIKVNQLEEKLKGDVLTIFKQGIPDIVKYDGLFKVKGLILPPVEVIAVLPEKIHKNQVFIDSSINS